ncbi:MAG: Na+/H+ antiporter NhaA [Gemmatimonadaceae bacterium]
MTSTPETNARKGPGEAHSEGGAQLVTRHLRPFYQFAASGPIGSILLVLCTVIALIWANSPWAGAYFALWHTEIVIGTTTSPHALSLQHWINDGLMVVFFLLVGLEIKREFAAGELSSPRHASLPIIAALGGMVVPALLYVAVNGGTDALRGWGIPMATDIAFALGVLTLMGPRVPIGLKIFLTALAIIDDMGAVAVIALFYTETISLPALLSAIAAAGVLVALNKLRVRALAPYLLIGVALWIAVLSSGIHATIAGVVLAFTIPVQTRIDAAEFSTLARFLLAEFERTETGDRNVLTSKGQREAIHALETASEAVQSPLLRLEHALAPIAAFAILPLFALANAGVSISEASAPWASSVGFGVLIGLLFGKPVGITLFSWIAVRLGWSSLPRGIGWAALHGAGWLGGIGFTMALFIAGLAFEGTPLLEEAKLGILLASLLAVIVGSYLVLRSLGRRSGPPGE